MQVPTQTASTSAAGRDRLSCRKLTSLVLLQGTREGGSVLTGAELVWAAAAWEAAAQGAGRSYGAVRRAGGAHMLPYVRDPGAGHRPATRHHPGGAAPDVPCSHSKLGCPTPRWRGHANLLAHAFPSAPAAASNMVTPNMHACLPMTPFG